ncbi:MAG: hypothetical protein N4A33_09145 [Bacteriovoracaceae bacterium]|nr:hypothetical protein [Bacteriovoracaceae bacterium]
MQLGADKSLLYQFLIVLVMLVLSKVLFLGHLQKVIENRIDKTTKLEGSADDQFAKANDLEQEYKDKMGAAHKKIASESSDKKFEITKELEAKYKSVESETNAYVDERRSEAQAQANKEKDSILANADELSNLLVQKITKG